MIMGVLSLRGRARIRASADFVHIGHTASRRCIRGGAVPRRQDTYFIEGLIIWDRTEWLDGLPR